MAKKCTASVHELLEQTKGTPYGVEVKRSKKGKIQNISANETIDSFKDVIEADCSDADKHGRFADTPASEGGAVKACEESKADNAPCFLVAGKIPSTGILKKRLAAKYNKPQDSFEEYEERKYEALKPKYDITDFNSQRKVKSFPGRETSAKLKRLKSLYSRKSSEYEQRKKREGIGRIPLAVNRKTHALASELVDLKEKIKTLESSTVKGKTTKKKKSVTKKKETRKVSAIPSEIYYYKLKEKCILYLTQAWYNKMYPQYQAKIKTHFRWNPYERVWISKTKNAESLLKEMGIQERQSPIKVVTPEKVKEKKKFALIQSSRSTGNNETLALDFSKRLDKIESNQKAIANVVIHMKPKVDKIEKDMQTVKAIVVQHKQDKSLHGADDIF